MRFTFQSTLARSSQYRPDIDGLRAVAVLSVLFFHEKIKRVAGGFVGVDIFFVISGYLITSIIAKDIASGKFSFISFYERRLRRIFPALFFVLFGCTVIAAVLFTPEDFIAFAKETIATTCFVSNFYFLSQSATGGYFANLSDLQTLLHTWSLAVEEQFYFLFPALLLLLWRWAKLRAVRWLAVLAVISFALGVWLTHRNPSAAFYLLPSRAWELLLGSLLALNAVPPIKIRFVREFAGIVGLALIACSDLLITDQMPFPGWIAFAPCFGAWLIIYAGKESSTWANTILAFPPLVFIGVISYSLYLWHWPLIVFAQYVLVGDLGRAAKIAVICASLLMAFLSFEFVESPFRGRDSAFSRRQVFTLGLAASLVSLALAFTISSTGGLPQRFNAATRKIVVENEVRRHDFLEICGNWKTDPHRWADINLCVLGPNASKKILFWGDSHVLQLYPLVKHLYDTGDLQGRGAIFAIANSCPPAEHINETREGFHCDAFSSLAMTRAKEQDIDTVFIGFFPWWFMNPGELCRSVDGRCLAGSSLEDPRTLVLPELSDEIRQLQSLGKRVIVCLPFPSYVTPVPTLEIRNAVVSRFGFARIATDGMLPDYREQFLDVFNAEKADIFDPRKSLCNQGSCVNQVDGISIYKDNNHIAASQIGILEDNFRQVLDRQVAPPVPQEHPSQGH